MKTAALRCLTQNKEFISWDTRDGESRGTVLTDSLRAMSQSEPSLVTHFPPGGVQIMPAYTQKKKRIYVQGRRSVPMRGAAFLLAVLFLLVSVLSGCSSASSGVNAGSASNAGASSDQAAINDGSSAKEGGDHPGSRGRALTLMLYLCGSDLESKTGAATRDLEEIMSSGVNTDLVNVVIMAGGTTKWENGFSHEETAVYVLNGSASGSGSADGSLQWEKKETFSSPEQEEAPADMGEESTLKAFLDYSYEQYPAEEYALIMWNHGGGPMRGLCWDTVWAKDNLSMEEFTGALKSSPFAEEKLGWIGFDACLMSSIETAHLVTPYADYMIASEESEPEIGWAYGFLSGIEKDGDAKETGKKIVDSYIAGVEAYNESRNECSPMTLSCMDLSRTGNVEEKLDSFFKKLKESLSPETFSELSNMREATLEFGKAMNESQRYDLVDLGDLVANYAEQAPEEAEALHEALREMVVYSRSSLDNCSGLSAYHPYSNKTYYEKLWRDEYDTFDFAPDYTDYIKSFAEIWLGDAMGDWSQMNKVQPAGVEGETQYFSVQLTPEQLQYYAVSDLLVLTEPYAGEYSQVFKTNQVTVDENGVLTAGYNGRTLYAVDEDGTIVTGPLNYDISRNGNIEIYMMYENLEGSAEQEYEFVILECEDKPAGINLPVLEHYAYDEAINAWSNRLEIREEDYQYLFFSHILTTPSYEGDQVKPYSEWERTGNFYSYEIPLTKEIHFRFYDHILDDSRLFACFEISDTQTNKYGTELMEVNNPNVTAIRFEGGVPDNRSAGPAGTDSDGGSSGSSSDAGASGSGEKYVLENDYLRLTVTGYLNNSELSKSLDLNCIVENICDQALNVDLQNGVKLSDSSRTCICVPSESTMDLTDFAPGESRECSFEIEKTLLAGLSDLKTVSFALDCEKYIPEDAETGDGAGQTSDIPQAGDMGLELVLHPVELNLSDISGYKEYAEDPQGLAAYTDGTMKWTLRSAQVQRDGDIKFVMICKNEGTEAVETYLPFEIAVNDILLKTDTYYDEEFSDKITLGPGEELSIVSIAENIQFFRSEYEHLGGTHHLTISDVLGAEGVKEIRTLAVYRQFDYVESYDLPGKKDRKKPVRFTLSDPIPLERTVSEKVMDDSAEYVQVSRDSQAGSETAGDPIMASPGESQDRPAEEEMTRAMDAGGKAPVRTELFSEDGVTVYGEYFLIADTTISMSLIMENKSDKDALIQFGGWKKGGPESDAAIEDFGFAYISFASTTKRIYLGLLEEEEAEETGETPDTPEDGSGNGSGLSGPETEPEAVEDVTLYLWKSGISAGTEQVPSIYQAVFSFADDIAYNVEGGVSVPVQETNPSVTCITEEIKDKELFEKKVSYPENPQQYRKEYSFTLPGSISGEKRDMIREIRLGVYQNSYPLLEEDVQEDLMDNLREKGFRDQTPDCMQFLSHVTMTESADLKDTYTCTYSGLVCVPENYPEYFYCMKENSLPSGETQFSFDYNDPLTVMCYWELIPGIISYNGYFCPRFRFEITAGNESADMTGLSIEKSEDTSNYEWAPGLFEVMEFVSSIPVYCGKTENNIRHKFTDLYVNLEENYIFLDVSPQALKLIPAEEYGTDVKAAVLVFYEDGAVEVYDVNQ